MINPEKLKELGLTAEQLRSFRYFYSEQGDVTRWVLWETLKPKLNFAFPEIMVQLEVISRAENTLESLFDNVSDLANEVDLP